MKVIVRSSKKKNDTAPGKGAHDERLNVLGQEIRRQRKTLRLSQGALARRIGKSTATISKIESASQPVDMATFLRISDVLRLGPEQLLLRMQLAGNPSPPQRTVLDIFRRTIDSLNDSQRGSQ
jgi:transcriptional regulator with XRE-family HTH domain